MAQILWFVWAFACAFGVRHAAVRYLAPRWGRLGGYLGGYALWLVLVALGLTVVWVSGLNARPYDPSDLAQRIGFLVLTYSPLGLPTFYGAPMVLVLDGVMAAVRFVRSKV